MINIDGNSPKPPGKLWRVGTLTYTSAGIIILFLWLLLGDFAWSMRERSVGPMAQWYLKSLDVPNLLFGLLIASFPAGVGMILGPIISVKSDRHRGKRGRRIPFLLITTPIAAFGMIGLAVTPLIAKWLHGSLGINHSFGLWLHHSLDGTETGAWILTCLQNEMVVSVVCFGVFWAMFEFASIAGNAVFGGLINDVVPKELLGRFYGLFRAVSLIDGMIFNFWIMGTVPRHFTLILIAISIFYSAAFMWVCFNVREGDYPPPVSNAKANPNPRRRSSLWFGEISIYFKECFGASYYIYVFILIMCAGLSFGPINTYSIPYARNLGINMDVYGKYLALTYLISLALSWFIGWMVDRFHPLRMVLVTLLGYAMVTAWGAWFARTPDTFLISWVLHGVFSGCYFTSAASLGQRLFPHSRFAQFASAAGILSCIAGMVMAPVVGMVIDTTGQAYHYTFAAACVLALSAFAMGIVVHGKFMKLGGPHGYIAPE